jgi:hypothetical protein
LRPEVCNEAREALSPDPHLQRALLHVDPLDEQLHDPSLLGREQLVPDRGEVGEQDRDLALGDLVVALALRCRLGARHHLSPGQQLLDSVEHHALTPALAAIWNLQRA